MPTAKPAVSKRFAKEVRKCLNRHDLMGLIAEGAPEDEYEYQEAAILRKLPNCKSVLSLQAMLHDEFCHWFNAHKAGSADRYRAPATDLFRLYKEFTK